MRAETQRRAPGSGAVGSVDEEIGDAVEAVGEVAEDAMREPGEGEELAAVSVAGELQGDTGVFGDL